MTEINKDLIEKALSLTGKTMEDMYHFEDIEMGKQDYKSIFYYPKFYAYLLSPEFIDKYQYAKDIHGWSVLTGAEIGILRVGRAIWNHQSGNPKPLEHLLSKL